MKVRRVSSWASVFIGMIALVVIVSGVLVGQEAPTGKLNFVDAPGSPINAKGAWSAVIGDFNEDGHLDIAVLCSCYYSNCVYPVEGTAAVGILLGNGDGTFSEPTYFPVGIGSWNCYEIATGDFNGDGHLDLAVTNPGTGDFAVGKVGVFILLGDGKGGFKPKGWIRTGREPSGMAVGDFDEDGNIDLAVACLDDRVTVILGDGKGGAKSENSVQFKLNTQPAEIVAADFNEDGHLDLATCNYGTGEPPYPSVWVLRGDGTGEFTKETNYLIINTPEDLAVGDFYEDGHPDIAVINQGTEVKPGIFKAYVSLLSNIGKGVFAGPANVETGITDLWRMAVADFNGDGHLDLALVSTSSCEVSVFLGDGKGDFHPCHRSPFLYGREGMTPGFPWIGAGDFNEDGRPDLAIVAFVQEIAIKLSEGGSR